MNLGGMMTESPSKILTASNDPIHGTGAAGTARPEGARQWQEARLLFLL